MYANIGILKMLVISLNLAFLNKCHDVLLTAYELKRTLPFSM